MKFKALLLFMLLLCVSTAIAAPVSGTFQLNGIATATPTTFTWENVGGTPPDFFTLSLGTGSFAVEDGNDTIQNLNNAVEPVGVSFAPQDFIDFDVTLGLPSLLVNFINPGNGGTAGCTQPAMGTTPPQSCTPVIPGGSPVTFTNNNVGGAVTASAATFSMSGITSDHLSVWTANFTVPFDGESYQDVLNTFATTGSVTKAVSANVLVTAVPEPSAALMLGVGGFLCLLLCRRQRRRS